MRSLYKPLVAAAILLTPFNPIKENMANINQEIIESSHVKDLEYIALEAARNPTDKLEDTHNATIFYKKQVNNHIKILFSDTEPFAQKSRPIGPEDKIIIMYVADTIVYEGLSIKSAYRDINNNRRQLPPVFAKERSKVILEQTRIINEKGKLHAQNQHPHEDLSAASTTRYNK
jgi:hypothetical protein